MIRIKNVYNHSWSFLTIIFLLHPPKWIIYHFTTNKIRYPINPVKLKSYKITRIQAAWMDIQRFCFTFIVAPRETNSTKQFLENTGNDPLFSILFDQSPILTCFLVGTNLKKNTTPKFLLTDWKHILTPCIPHF